MKKQCGIYYFEVQIISKGIDGHIAIGFCRKINSLDRLPGMKYIKNDATLAYIII